MFSIIAHHFLFCNNFFVKLFCKILAPVTIPLFSSLRGFSKVSGIERKIWRIVFWEWRGMFRAPFQNPGTSKGLKKCLNAKRHSGQLAFAQTIPSHRLTTFFHPLRSSSRFLQSHMPHTSPHPERFIKTSASLPLHFLPEAQWSKTGGKTVKQRGLKGLPFIKPSGRAFVFLSLFIH